MGSTELRLSRGVRFSMRAAQQARKKAGLAISLARPAFFCRVRSIRSIRHAAFLKGLV
ncbi:hypothetical protein PCAR4_40014 [Paraburkholderia caribensis]|nr:hypothetical protein PCAR4_40014 [Paraburkholderia caribensis]